MLGIAARKEAEATETALAAVAALAAAALFGCSSVLMARAASAAPRDDMLRFRLLVRLVRSRTWLLGAALQPISFCVQALALAVGPLALAQPIAAPDLLFALPVQARLVSRRRLRGVEWAGGLLVAGGVFAFLTISPPAAGQVQPTAAGWSVIAATVGGGATLAAVGAVHSRGVVRTTLLAAAGGATFALLDVVSKAAVGVLRSDGLLALLTGWYPYGLAAVGVAGLVLSQSAFQSGPLQLSLPVIDTVEPTLAVLVGAIAFHEALAASPAALAGQLAAAAVALAGIAVLDRVSLRPGPSSLTERPRHPGRRRGRPRPEWGRAARRRG